MSKPIIRQMVVERGYSSITRRSLIESPEFKGKLTVNGHDIVKIYLDTIALGAQGYMKYRTIYVYPQVDKQIESRSRTSPRDSSAPRRRCIRRSKTRWPNCSGRASNCRVSVGG